LAFELFAAPLPLFADLHPDPTAMTSETVTIIPFAEKDILILPGSVM